MKKVSVSGSLLSPEQSVKFTASGFFYGKVLKYVDNNVDVELDINNDILIRRNSEYEIRFYFLKESITKNTLKLYELGEAIQLNLYTIDLVKTTGNYYVKYELNDDELFEFSVSYE